MGKTGVINVAMAPDVLEALHEEHGQTLLYVGGSGLHHLHLDDGMEHERDQDWESKKPLNQAFEENLKEGLAKLQKRYPDAGLAYLNTHSICNSKLWDSTRAAACDSDDLKECFSDVDIPSKERDWFQETVFSQHGSGVIAEREIATLDDASLKWTLVHGHEITEEASCSQTADGMHYLEPTMMMKREKAQHKMRKVEEVRKKNAGKQGEGDHKK